MSKSAASTRDQGTGGLVCERRHTTPGTHPFDEVEWELRDAVIGDPENPAFEQRGVEFPKAWSQNATNIVAQKYFRGRLGSDDRERSVRQMISRVAGTIAGWGREGGYFASDEDADAFEAELTHILLHQKAAFNSPVWFNVGFEEHPQCSACFILSVEDTMESILDWNTKEGMIFRGGSGSGINLSNIRGSVEQLSKGGFASGPVSFMRGADAWAGTIKSGGKTRRAAKMVVLDVDHPDIEDFIWCKAREEEKAAALRDAGFDMSIDGDGFTSIQYQNANNSVRVTDEFMEAVEADADWDLIARNDGRAGRRPLDARELLAPDRRRGLALRRPRRPVRHDDQPLAHLPRIGADQRVESLLGVHARRRLGLQPRLAQPDEVPPRGRQLRRRGASSTPSTSSSWRRRSSSGRRATRPRRSASNARAFRQLGLGYANLGALLMSDGVPYDSDEGRNIAAAITALMTGRGYRKSARDRRRGRPLRRVRARTASPTTRSCGCTATPRYEIDGEGDQGRAARGRAPELGRGGRARRAPRLPQRPGDGAGADRDDQLPDGLRHDRDRARLLAGQVQGAGRRRADDDRQPDGADGARDARLHAAAGRADRGPHQRERDDRRRAGPGRRAPTGVRRRRRRARDLAHGPHQDDGRGAAVPLGGDLEDGQPAADGDDRGHRRGLHRGPAGTA